MVKFGELILNHGKWQGQQLIPEAYITRATSPNVHSYSTYYYGFFWWVDEWQAGTLEDRWVAPKTNRGKARLLKEAFILNLNSAQTYQCHVDCIMEEAKKMQVEYKKLTGKDLT